MCGDDLPNDNQSHSGSFFLGSHKRLKCIDVQRDAFAPIGDFQYDNVVGQLWRPFAGLEKYLCLLFLERNRMSTNSST